MTLKNCLLCVLIPVFSIPGFSQRRMSVDLNTQMTHLFATVNYMSVIRNKFFWTTGIEAGYYGFADRRVEPGTNIVSPYASANQDIVVDGLSYKMSQYSSLISAIGVSGGAGRFFNFTDVHGLRVEATARFLYFEDIFLAGYDNPNAIRYKTTRTIERESAVGLNLNLYHTIALSNRWTFYYGLKIPYYIPLSHKSYRPTAGKDMMNKGKETHLSMGLSWIIGKDCKDAD